MESDDLSSFKVVEGDIGLGLGNNFLKFRFEKMEGEGKKSRVKEKVKPVEIGIDCDDDEPIGSLLKLKKPGVSKKNKMNSGSVGKVVAGDEDIGGMDDTLASFRKKLKGPKKDAGPVIARAPKVSVKRGKIRVEDSNDLEALKFCGVANEDQKEEVSSFSREGLNHSLYEKFQEDSLSVFLQKAQSGLGKKSVVNLNVKQSAVSQTLQDELSHNPEDHICRGNSIVGANDTVDIVLEECKMVKTRRMNDGFLDASSNISNDSKEVKDEGILESCMSNLRRFSGDPCSSHTVCNGNCLVSDQNESPELQNLKNESKITSVGNAVSLVCDTEGIDDVFAKRKDTSTPFDGMSENRSSKYASDDGPVSNVLYGYKVNSENVLFSPAKENAAACDIGLASASATSSDALEQKLSSLMQNKEIDEVTGISPQCILTGENEMYTEDVASLPDTDIRDANLSLVQRTLRKAKRRRHEDMAYEGDADWDSLINEQKLLENDPVVDYERYIRGREKSDSSSVSAIDVENSGLAAVSVGLRAHAVGPVEKIKFKEVLKCKGGLHDYLECRNKILRLWNKDVSRILPLSECGVTNTPSQDESTRDSLIRNVYAFLDQSGYINVGVASVKEQGEPNSKHNLKLFNETNIEGNTGSSITDMEDGVSFIVGQFRSSETPPMVKNEVATDNDDTAFDFRAIKSADTAECKKFAADFIQQNGAIDATLPNALVSVDSLISDHSFAIQEGREVSLITPELDNDIIPELNDDMQIVQSLANENSVMNDDLPCDVTDRKKILVIGAGPAGLVAARHLKRQGFAVTILEARNRLGGRVYTDNSSLSVPVDLGASIITGVEADVDTERRPDPSSLICAQLGLELTVLNSDCPLYDTVTGEKVPTDLDEALEAEYNSLLDDMVLVVAQKGERASKMSLEDGLEYILKTRRVARVETHIDDVQDPMDALHNSRDAEGGSPDKPKEDILSPLERRIMNWHFAHLEYGCAALLKDVSLPYWNQDDIYGGFGGAHCMIKGGYSNVVESLGDGLPIHLNHVVTDISYGSNRVKVSTSNGSEFSGDAVLITAPLGCLKAETIKFSPSLPEWKRASIQRLGFGVLNKVVLEFPEVFWDDSVDYFGATAEEPDERGHCFMFWNVRKTVGAPVLIALVVGKAAIDSQRMSASDHVNHAVKCLRKLFGESSVPEPVGSVVTNWGNDPFSYGAYSYVAVGSSGEDYDILGRPVDNCLFFAGEATCKEHPDTVGGAMMSGLREAVRIIDIFYTGKDYTAEVEAIEAAQRLSDSENDEVSDIIRRLEAVELSNAFYRTSLDRPRIFSREALLQDLFFSAKTIAGRLRLAKELLKIPSETLKSFAGTKKGLTMLNSWILDSMGKDGTQLLRHCVRLLVRVSTDLLAVRLSGIGKTVKEKVCVHTSRDIRTIASQLVNVWLEVFRKEKATNGGLKLLRQVNESSKRKSLANPASGKPPLCTHHARPFKMESEKDPKLESSGYHTEEEAGQDHAMTEEEQAALAAVEAARAAARAAAEAYASAQAKCNMLHQLPKIPSFHKFAKREHYGPADEFDLKRRSSGVVLGRQDCRSEIDSRNCRVRDWSLDFSAAYVEHDSSRKSVDNLSQRSHSNEIACHMNFREQTGESAAVDSSLYTKAWVDTAGIKDYHAIERWQDQAAAADANFYHSAMLIRDEEDSNTSSKPRLVNESTVSNVTVSKEPLRNHPRGADLIKQAVVDYVASLLMPVYKTRKIDRNGYKSIMKKCATKVMEQATDAEKSMSIPEFLHFKRKNKIRVLVDKLIERHMATNPAGKP